MFARVTRVASSPDSIDQRAATFQRDLMPRLREQPGFLGAGILADRESGRGAAVTYWEDAGSMRASEPVASAGREQATQAGGTILDIHGYELLIVERVAPPGANVFVRTTEIDVAADRIEDFVQFARDRVLPGARGRDGFRALLLGVERETGHCLVSSIWNTAADRDATEAVARDPRRELAQIAGGGEPRVELYEVMFAEVKQPATAAPSA